MKKFLIRSSVVAFSLIVLLTGYATKDQIDKTSKPDVSTQQSTVETAVKTPQKTVKKTAKPLPKPSKTPLVSGKYRKITVYGGDISGYREKMVVVDVGFGDREYWAYTNQYGQLFKVTAKKIILQNHSTEPVLESGRYFEDEAKVPGTEREDLDEGHVIADSLGGVSNAYNITPQNSVLNRHGDQAYMEKVIRDAGGCTNFTATITYPNTKTQIPSHYKFVYTLMGNVIRDEFDNVNPDIVNRTQTRTQTKSNQDVHDISQIDTNSNGGVTIAEAKAAGFTMPIIRDHWLYKYMTDGDGDGMVGE